MFTRIRPTAGASDLYGLTPMVRQRARRVFLLAGLTVAVALWGSACARAEVDAVVTGELTWGDCRSGAWTWEPSFAALNLLDDGSALLRFQSSPGGLDRDDYITFLIRDYAELAEDGFPLEVEVVGASPDVFRAATASMALTESCPEERDLPVDITGTLRLDEVDTGRRGEVAGSFVIALTGSNPPQPVLSTALNGSFRFDFRDDPPYSTLR
jgi:hypothetical protein